MTNGTESRGTKRTSPSLDCADPDDETTESAFKRFRFTYPDVEPQQAPEDVIELPSRMDPDHLFTIEGLEEDDELWDKEAIPIKRAQEEILEEGAEEDAMVQGGVRHKRWWFWDGDVVVRLRKEMRLYKLHARMLGRYLKGFRERLETDDTGETVDGLQVLDEDETVANWDLMCLLLYNPKAFGHPVAHWDDVVAVLALSRRYGCLRFREAAACLLSTVCPTTLPSFTQLHRLGRIVGGSRACRVHVVHLAIEYNLPELLPAALLELADLGTRDIVLGIPTKDGGVVRLDDDVVPHVVLGREQLLKVRREVVFGFLWKIAYPAPGFYAEQITRGCPCAVVRDGYTCQRWLLRLGEDWDSHAEEMWEWRGVHRALRGLGEDAREYVQEYLCHSCRTMLEVEMAKGRRAVWLRLPSMFGLGNWFELQRKGRAAREQEFAWFVRDEEERIQRGEGEEDWSSHNKTVFDSRYHDPGIERC
ncbi:hypothetical protein BV25DRAFT_407668 [Artomyces pyxidatus]|uniref:Uncharacterized protein n=1 Tax=Artomyces pyxidatus TaxID=48021 RepID=A0ACB8SE17_9AGAM|nr:hypothetical protein BV25DRAFT_407668 [Artomyces pyxidatus]